MSGPTFIGAMVLVVVALYAAVWALDWWRQRRGRRD
jgi:hypothetical protein